MLIMVIIIYMEVNKGNKSDSMKKTEEQFDPKVTNLSWGKVNVKTFQF